MPGSGTGTFIDPDDYLARFNHVRIDLLATSQGALKADLTGQLSIAYSCCAARRICRGSPTCHWIRPSYL
jgi:hypothetical protein